jgi:hypothetical protein
MIHRPEVKVVYFNFRLTFHLILIVQRRCLTMTTVTIIKIITDINKHTIVHHAPSNKDSLANVIINENTAVATTKIISTMDDVIDVELLESSLNNHRIKRHYSLKRHTCHLFHYCLFFSIC